MAEADRRRREDDAGEGRSGARPRRGAEAEGVHARGAPRGDQGVQAGDGARGGRLRPGVQGMGRRAHAQPGQEQRRRHRRCQEAQPGERPGPAGVAVRGQLLGQIVSPQPGEAAGLLRRGQGAAPGVRVHVQGQPGKPSLQEGFDRAAAMEHEAQDRHRRGARAGLPALVGEAGHLPGLQGLQHPPRLGLHGEAVGLRAGEERPVGGEVPRDDACHRHLRLRGAGVRGDGPPVREERRVRLRRRAAGAAHGAARARPQPAGAPAQPGGVGAALPLRQGQAREPHGPAPRRPVPAQGRAPGRQARQQVPRRRPQEPAVHGRSRRRARGRRDHAGARWRRSQGAPPGPAAAARRAPVAVP